MNVLFLTCHLPFPAWSGGRLREFEMLRRLAPRHSIEVCAVSRTFDDDTASLEAFRKWVPTALFESDGGPAESGSMAQASFLMRRNYSAAASSFVASRLASGAIDLVHCEGFYMRGLLREVDVPVFLFEQNIEYRVWPQSRERIRREEIDAWRWATRCGAITPNDAAMMAEIVGPQRVMLSYNGSDHSAVLPLFTGSCERPLPSGPLIVFAGNFDYQPSHAAGVTMCTEIGPAILERVAAATVVLVGNGSERLAAHVEHPRIEVHGRVASLEPYYSAAAVIACPLRSGGGIKVKLLEALARGCGVVTTSIGQQGLEDAPLIVADPPERFVEEVVRLLLDSQARAALRASAAAYARSMPTWDDAARRLESCWQATVLAGSAVCP